MLTIWNIVNEASHVVSEPRSQPGSDPVLYEVRARSTRPAKSSLTRQSLNGKLAEEPVPFWSENPHELVAILDQVEENLNGNGRS